MTSRRPMTRSFSGNGRTSSFSEEEGSSSNGRSESRNPYLSNVRPENRSTLCSVMAQLTEDIQPSFETTLKSKAVSENCNVKFTCVVSGYPAPELKWYKDDMEIDRYCGLPKYEIRRNGKTHTLHIYNCTLDDAAIYQVSASNSKGIVSCSGVLEVGTMNEYKIHQRFFAKLKQKAEKKKKDLEEQNKKDDKESIKKEKPQSSPERPPRKRPIPPPKEKAVVKELEPGEQLVAAAEPNGMKDKDSLFVTVYEEVPVNHQELDSLVVSPQPANQTPGDDSLPRQDMSVSPQTKTISDREGPLSTDKMAEEGKPDTEKELSPSKLCQGEKAEVKSSKPPCSVINRSEMTDLATSSLEERIEPCESIPPDQVLSALSSAAVDIIEEDRVKEEAECSSLAQEMNVGYPPSATLVSLQSTDLKVQPECPPPIAEESAKVHIFSSIPTPNSSLTSSEEKCDLKDVLNSVSAEAANVSLYHNLSTQEHTILEGEKTEARNEYSQSDIETEKSVQGFGEPKIVSVAQSEGSSGNDENNKTPQPDGGETQLGWPSEDIPQIQITTIEDTPDKTVVPDANQNEHFVIPKIEIVGPELKECTEPLTVQNPNEPETAILQKHDATHVPETIMPNQSMTDFQASLPTEEGMQADYSVSQSQKVKDVAQLDDKSEILEPQPSMQTNEQFPQTGYASIPLINVSCTDDKENYASVNANVSHALQPIESPRVPLFAVPPISLTCHESDSEMKWHTHSGRPETDTSVIIQRGTENDVMTVITGRKHNKEDVSENIPSLLYEAPLPKVGDNAPSVNKAGEDNANVPKIKPLKEAKIENEDLQRNRCSVERLSCKPPAHPSLSPASLRKYMGKVTPDSDSDAVVPVPVITVGDHHNDRADEDLSGGSTPTLPLSCESSPRMKRRDSLSLIRSATPEELASGARRKIFIPKTKDDGDGAALGIQDTQGKKETPYMSPSQARRAALLQASMGQHTPPMERRSPLLGRRKTTLEVPKVVEETPKEETATTKEEKPAEKRPDPLKAPQVIRKIRGEPFPDASGHLKLWCQFFNVLSDSTIKWFRDEEEILEVKRSGGDESQVALAIVLASSQDCGVYGCTIKNEYGTDTTDFLLSADILSEILLRDDLEVGEEIEMTPLLFTKGLADCGNWGNKYFGRIMTETANIGEGCAHKASRVKVIYGLDPIFDSGSNCVIKVQSPIAYGTKEESNLAERNQELTKQECKVQNMIREYCKIFAAEARVIENFGHSLEVIPQYLMYRPANSVPYATVEADLAGVFRKYCTMEPKGRLITRTTSEVEQKCSTFQHWIHQWTHGNLLVTQLEGVEAKLTNVRVVTKSKGYQGLTECGSPELFDQFLTQHQCNYFCGLLGLRPLAMDNLLQPTKMKGSRSPLLNRKLGSSSPQLQRKGHSPQLSRKANSSPKVTRKVQEPENNKSDSKPKPAEIFASKYG
uniref:non-specific serine/threonine protein kinase n=1 Tax=Echeneis naucrates TaxID=173247 RepID=A0A665VD89_ECHNA